MAVKRLLFLSWRDIKNPKAGGAEVFTHEMLKRLAQEYKYEVDHFSCWIPGLPEEEVVDGVRYIRKGGILGVIRQAMRWYNSQPKAYYSLVVDQSNTHQFFSPLWLPKKQKKAFFIHQLTREIWFKNIFFPINLIGFLVEPIIIKIHKKSAVLTVSESTQKDLIRYGFNKNNVFILPEGLNFKPWAQKDVGEKSKTNNFTLLYVGRFVKYKGIEATIEAFYDLYQQHKDARLWLAGRASSAYVLRLKRKVKKLGLTQAVTFYGFISTEEKLKLMNQANVLVFPSSREGWGLIVTEANAVGTPAVVYNSPGLRDSVKHNETGLITEANTPASLALALSTLKESPKFLQQLSSNAYKWSHDFHWDHTGKEADECLKRILTAEA